MTLTKIMLVSQDMGQQHELENLANTDALTGLFNKRYFEKMMEIRDEKKKPYALFYMDLDLFKPVNDTYGHEMGDKVLKEVAKRLLKCIRSNDYAFRIGGDEFMLILNGNLDAQICEKRIERIKKLIALLLAAVMCLSLAACDNGKTENTDHSQGQNTENTSKENQQTETASQGNGNTEC